MRFVKKTALVDYTWYPTCDNCEAQVDVAAVFGAISEETGYLEEVSVCKGCLEKAAQLIKDEKQDGV